MIMNSLRRTKLSFVTACVLWTLFSPGVLAGNLLDPEVIKAVSGVVSFIVSAAGAMPGMAPEDFVRQSILAKAEHREHSDPQKFICGELLHTADVLFWGMQVPYDAVTKSSGDPSGGRVIIDMSKFDVPPPAGYSFLAWTGPNYVIVDLVVKRT